MRLQHGSRNPNMAFRPEEGGVAGPVAFFSIFPDTATDRDLLCKSYLEGEESFIYELHILHGDEIIQASQLVPDEQALLSTISAARRHHSGFSSADLSEAEITFDCDGDEVTVTIEDLIDGSQEGLVDEEMDFSWAIQRIRAELGMRMGYLGVKDKDDQGDVVMVATSGREEELNARLRPIGRHLAGKRFVDQWEADEMEEGVDFIFHAGPDLKVEEESLDWAKGTRRKLEIHKSRDDTPLGL